MASTLTEVRNMTDEEFWGIIKATLKDLPLEFKDQLDNVEITIQDWPDETDFEEPRTSKLSLFGLYHGVPKPDRYAYSALPDKITLFKEPILHASTSIEETKQIIRDTVLHELGHHLGLSDEELAEHNV